MRISISSAVTACTFRCYTFLIFQIPHFIQLKLTYLYCNNTIINFHIKLYGESLVI